MNDPYEYDVTLYHKGLAPTIPELRDPGEIQVHVVSDTPMGTWVHIAGEDFRGRKFFIPVERIMMIDMEDGDWPDD